MATLRAAHDVHLQTDTLRCSSNVLFQRVLLVMVLRHLQILVLREIRVMFLAKRFGLPIRT